MQQPLRLTLRRMESCFLSANTHCRLTDGCGGQSATSPSLHRTSRQLLSPLSGLRSTIPWQWPVGTGFTYYRSKGVRLMIANTVQLHRALRATPDQIYRAFLDADTMARWCPPNGFTAKVHHMDAKVGGT